MTIQSPYEMIVVHAHGFTCYGYETSQEADADWASIIADPDTKQASLFGRGFAQPLLRTYDIDRALATANHNQLTRQLQQIKTRLKQIWES